eukprot:CAMPEP_0173282564 /NCGR_PEP_ID=MMETSP1143-20121109/6890_1 /TAXON_ID=483371 /ORGANISM="non described non described, Strain CCMP2298" /LENGTH=418 /DNA_ID=CAMNT_0014220149 /DNA_START=63 /DNA_END=1320 /DNA_ORIENTATION=+
MDRLQQLKKGAAVEDVSVDVEEEAVLINPARKTGDAMQEFFGDVEIVKANIVVIKEATRKIAEINQNVLQATTSDRESDYSHELEPLVKSTNKKRDDWTGRRSEMDRLKELQKGAKQLDESETESDRVSLVNVANSSSSGAGQADLMQQFFGDIEIIKSNVVVIREATRKIAEINQNVLQATTTEREQDSSYELEPIVKNTNKKASLAKQLLQRLREDTERMKTSNEGAKMTPEIRIRENLANTLTRKFVDVMKEYQNAQTKYKTDIKKKVKRQVQIVKPDATSEEIDAVFKSGGGSGDVLKSAILSGEAAESVQNAYMNVADKYQDVLTLEASVAELHQMFLDFALLTEQQGELLDQIEHQVKEAGEYVDSGNKELVESIELQKSIRAKQCCICVIILVVIGIIAGIVAAKTSGGFR